MKALKKALQDLGKLESKIEDTAGHLLAFIRDEDIQDASEWEAMITEAYQELGWRYERGRPHPEDERAPVPRTVQIYVSEIRAAFRHEIYPGEFETMGQLRSAVREARADRREGLQPKKAGGRPASKEKDAPPALKGVSVTDTETMIDGLFHDLIHVYLHLPKERQVAMEQSLRRIEARFLKELAVIRESEEPEEVTA